MKKAELINIWKEFCRRNGTFHLTDEDEIVQLLAEGVLNNEKNQELKYCPCRMTTGDWAKDIKLICPCNFKIQKTWTDKGECYCGLFIRS